VYCEQCGAELGAGHSFCAACGKPAGAGAAPVPTPAGGRLARRLTTLGVLWIVLSFFRLVAGAFTLMAGAFVCGMIRSGNPVSGHLVPAIVGFAGGFLVFVALAGFVAGWGLLERHTWARGLSLILAFLSLLDIPFGTALGIYTMIALLPAGTESEFRRLASAR